MTILSIGNDCGSFSMRKEVSRPGRRGFTLIEVLLAVVVLGFGIVGIMRSYAVAARALSVSSAKIESFCLAQEAFASLERPALPSTGPSPDTHLPPASYIQTATGTFIPGSKWILKIDITDDNNCRKVTIEVDQKPKSLSGSIRLYGYVAP